MQTPMASEQELKLLRQDFERLLLCLGHSKTLCQTTHKYHMQKFEATRLRYPLGLAPPLSACLSIKTLSLVRHFCGGREEILALRQASKGARASASCIFTGYAIYAIGGTDKIGGTDTRSADRFLEDTKQWTTVKQPSVTPVGSAASLLDGCCYVCGCQGPFGQSAQRLVLATEKWETLAPMCERRCTPAASALGGQLCILGGEDTVNGTVHDSAEVFDASAPWKPSRAGAWRLLPAAMSGRRRGLAAAAITYARCNELFICGGVATPRSQEAGSTVVPLASAEALRLFGREQKPWRLPSMAQARIAHVAASLHGKIFVCGGVGGRNTEVLSTVEIFDPASDTWACSAPMPSKRFNAAAAVLAGRLYVLGGAFGATAERSVQSLDPATGLWKEESWSLACGRSSFVAVATWMGTLADTE